MKKFIPTVLIGILPLLPFSLSAAPSYELTRDFWTSREFLNHFMGTYGFDGDREPRVSSEESELIQQLIPLVQQDRLQEAIRILAAAVKPESSAAFDFTLGNMYLQTGQHARAERAYREAIRKMPNFMNAHKNMGSLLVQQGRYQDAVPYLVKTIIQGGADGLIYGVLGYCYLNLQKYASAENAYRVALLLSPDNRDWKNGLIQSISAQEKHEELIGILNEVIAENPDVEDYWNFQANAYIAQERHMEAIANLEVVHRMGKSTGRGMLLLGDLYMREGVPSSALTSYQAALEMGAGMENAQFIRAASILISQGNYEEGEAYVNRIMDLRGARLSDAERLDLLNLQSEVYLATGQPDLAAETLEGIIQVDPMNGRALLNLADYYWRLNDYEEAEIMFMRAQRIERFEIQALVEHARMLVERRKYNEAAQLLRRVMVLEPQDRIARFLEAVERAAAARQT